MIKQTNEHKQFQDTYAKMYPQKLKINTKKRTGSQILVKTITFVVTEDCTLRCSYCYEHNKNYACYMTKETAKQAIDCILDNSKMGDYVNSETDEAVIIEFMGGEPTCNVELMHYIAEYFIYKTYITNHKWANNFMFNFTTNGTTYFEPRVQELLKKYKNRLSFTITLDGNRDLHDSCRVYPDGRGSYDDIIKAVKHAQEYYYMDSSKITLAPENLIYFNDAIKHFLELGITKIHANCVYEPVWNISDAKILYKELVKLADYIVENKLYETHEFSIFEEYIGQPQSLEENNNYCGGNGAMLAIGADGNFYPCIRFMPYSIGKERKPLIIGNIYDGIKPVEDNPCVKCLWDTTRRSACHGDSEKCFECPVSTGCGECNGLVYEKTGTPNYKLRGQCEMHKARVLANYYYWNKVYKIECMDKEFKLNLNDEEIKILTEEVSDGCGV